MFGYHLRGTGTNTDLCVDCFKRQTISNVGWVEFCPALSGTVGLVPVDTSSPSTTSSTDCSLVPPKKIVRPSSPHSSANSTDSHGTSFSAPTKMAAAMADFPLLLGWGGLWDTVKCNGCQKSVCRPFLVCFSCICFVPCCLWYGIFPNVSFVLTGFRRRVRFDCSTAHCFRSSFAWYRYRSLC
jgi:hypothetical protein